MGRRKSKPHRSGGILVEANATAEAEPDKHNAVEVGEEEKCDFDKPYFVEVDRSCWLSDEHLDISEVVLRDLNLREGFNGFDLSEDFYQDPQFSLRFRLCNVSNIRGRIKLGHWPVLPYTDIHLEFVKRATVDNTETCTVLLSGIFDGPDEGVSGLVHLTSLKFVTLRAVIGIKLSEDIPSLRIRVEVLKSAFDACESLLEVSRQLWKKSMMNVMSWLRPEIMTSEVKYGFSSYMDMDMEVDSQEETADDGGYAGKCSRFDPAGFYEAIRPSKAEPMLEDDIPDLLPELRPYQRRAAFWMVKREKVMEESQSESERNLFHSPLCVPVDFLDTRAKMFFNPFSGNISLCPETSSPYVFGGILADEMGLGKTVELLACIFAHRKSAYGSDILMDSVPQVDGDEKVTIKRLKRERVECICGAVSESLKYQGLWVQCDICDAWQHADCVGYSPKGKSLKSKQGLESKAYKTTIAVRNGEYVCQMCSELIQATESPIASGATLIVCPAPILPQWHDEIIRHTRPGALKTCIYEGVRETSFSNKPLMDVSDLASADIVLTTYDVLKEDLSHDSDRHIGDRHLLRFQKRYPVIPTLLTRISWWRICLDEAQMVESTVATAATEMALRLHCKHRWCVSGTPIQRKLDDLYGLLRFIKTSPFNIYRWWSEVIRDPYEKGDMGAMEFTHRIFKQIMWRSSKQLVADELDLPSQEECLSWLTLSPVEEHFYQRQHEVCVRDSHDVIESLRNDILNRKVPDSVSMSGSSDPLITHTEAGKLLNALLKLRQACCHPQVGSSGLRSIQQSPMTIEEVLMVLISKTKIEGEEALRRSVVALNALAAIFIIQKDYYQAALLYNEALTLAEEHSEDFRLDPLLNIHIHHNLAEIFPLAQNFALILPSKTKQFSGTSGVNTTKKHFIVKVDHDQVKRHKISSFDDANSTVASAEPSNVASSLSENDLNDREFDDLSASSVKYLIAECEDSKQKYLSVFSSKLAAAQQEFQSSYTQVHKAYHDAITNQTTFWWLEALHYAEQNKDFSTELIRKIEEALSGNSNSSKSPRIPARFRSIHSLKYQIQTDLDQLEASRKVLLDRLLEIDQTMEKPKDEDIERAGKCRNCVPNCDGPPCVLCELDELFQAYEARLFVLRNERGGIISSAEEAVDFQKQKFALNQFLSKLSQSNHSSSVSDPAHEESRKRNVGQKVVTSKLPSMLEVLLGVIMNYCKTQFGKDSVSAATKHLHIFEGMRKEYGYARSLALAQAQYLRAHDELKMAISRLRLKANEDDESLDALGENELIAASSNHSQEKFMSLALLSQIKGKLRYLKGLVQSKQKLPSESPDNSLCTQDTNASTEEKDELIPKTYEETCPICQEKLGHQRMVFQCGHVTCCKCLFAMSEQRLQHSKTHNWVMCPTCRQHTDFGNIAYAVDAQNESPNSSMLHTIDGCEKHEASITVKGSYGTKIEAITRRILWIKATDHKSKVLVFSSWNDVLDVLEHAFAANNITFIRMKGGRKAHTSISQFRGKPNGTKGCEGSEPKSIQVLLLLIQHGANGLNLLEAQHVVLVEPLLNPAAEAQAISRVHRIGQKNKTLIHRFLVKDTVEESIYKLNRRRSKSNHSFISGNTKNQDQPILTLKDVECLLATAPLTAPEIDETPTTNTNLRDLPPSVAAAIAAERRHNEQRT